MLAAIVVAMGAVALYKLHKLRKCRRHERAVLRELDACIDANRHDPVALAAALSLFLRRLALRDAHAAAYAATTGTALTALIHRMVRRPPRAPL